MSKPSELTFGADRARFNHEHAGGYGNFSSYGTSATSNLFTLNGRYQNDPFLNLNNSGATNLLLGQNEGNAIYYWNGRVMNANNWFNVQHKTPRPLDNANQWAGSFGGPIVKDKAFFFLNTEGLRVLIPTSTPVDVPSPQFQAATIANLNSLGLQNSPSTTRCSRSTMLLLASAGRFKVIPPKQQTPLDVRAILSPAESAAQVACPVSYFSDLP